MYLMRVAATSPPERALEARAHESPGERAAQTLLWRARAPASRAPGNWRSSGVRRRQAGRANTSPRCMRLQPLSRATLLLRILQSARTDGPRAADTATEAKPVGRCQPGWPLRPAKGSK